MFVAVAPVGVGQDRLRRLFDQLVAEAISVLPAEADALPACGRFPPPELTPKQLSMIEAEHIQVDYSKVRRAHQEQVPR